MRAHQHVRPLHQLELPSDEAPRGSAGPWLHAPSSATASFCGSSAPGASPPSPTAALLPLAAAVAAFAVSARVERHPRRRRPAARQPAAQTHASPHARRRRRAGCRRCADVFRIHVLLSTAPWHERSGSTTFAKHDGVAGPSTAQITARPSPSRETRSAAAGYRAIRPRLRACASRPFAASATREAVAVRLDEDESHRTEILANDVRRVHQRRHLDHRVPHVAQELRAG